MTRGCDPDDDWPDPLAHPWLPAVDLPATIGGDVHHSWLVDITAADLDAEDARRREQAWDRTGYGFRP